MTGDDNRGYSLLSLCARIKSNEADYQQLARTAADFAAWEELVTQAELDGLGPLLYTHLQAAGAPLPPSVKRQLQGLYLRHRQANQVRAQVLGEILSCYRAAGIQALVLKGAALAHLLYPQPGLRPMRDLDLLVQKSEVRPAQQLLADLGFQAHLPQDETLPGKHLAAASRYTAGLSVSVELHHNLFNTGSSASMEIGDLTGPPLPFTLGDSMAYTLGYEDLLWHLCRHLIIVSQSIRLIWVADIVGLAERFVAEIDWERIERQSPFVLSTLSLLHFITPLSTTLLEKAPLKIGRRPAGVGLEFAGWPRLSLATQRHKGYRRILSDTFFPPAWWLRLYYGFGSARPLFWCRWVKHPLQILGWTGQLLLERIGWREPA